MSRPRSAWRGLQTRMFLWFCGAVVVAVVASWVTIEVFRPPPMDRSHSFTRIVTAHLADIWDDQPACEAYLASLTPMLGMEVHEIRDKYVAATPPGPRWKMTPFGSERHGPMIVAVERGGEQVGAISYDQPMQPQPISRFFIVPLVYMTILSTAGWLVARRLSKPLVDVAVAAERFGSGDLNARAGLPTGKAHERWVAAEIEELATTFDQMADRISGVVRDQRELLAAISHELRSPLGRARVASRSPATRRRAPRGSTSARVSPTTRGSVRSSCASSSSWERSTPSSATSSPLPAPVSAICARRRWTSLPGCARASPPSGRRPPSSWSSRPR